MFLPLRLYSDVIIIQYSCLWEYGDQKGNAKPKTRCRKLGPLFASFNEAACDVYDGVFCPNPRSCEVLTSCVEKEISDTHASGRLFAYKEYLNQAPEVKDTDSSKECGALREYFGFEFDFPDDNLICDEFVHIQCRSDFSNLDETISSSSNGDTVADPDGLTNLKLKSTGKS